MPPPFATPLLREDSEIIHFGDILVVQTASEPVIPLPRVLKAAKAGPAPRVNLVRKFDRLVCEIWNRKV